jgi:hypothetical protein
MSVFHIFTAEGFYGNCLRFEAECTATNVTDTDSW